MRLLAAVAVGGHGGRQYRVLPYGKHSCGGGGGPEGGGGAASGNAVMETERWSEAHTRSEGEGAPQSLSRSGSSRLLARTASISSGRCLASGVSDQRTWLVRVRVCFRVGLGLGLG